MAEEKKQYPRRSCHQNEGNSCAELLDDKLTRFKSDILEEIKNVLSTQYIPKALDEDSCSELKQMLKSSVEEAISTFRTNCDTRLVALETKLEKLETSVSEKDTNIQTRQDKTMFFSQSAKK